MKKALILNIILSILICTGDVFYIIYGTIWLKSITSALFVVLGAINLNFAIRAKTENKKYAIIMFVGLVFAMLGDIVLEFNFIIGAILFAIGHIFFFVAYTMLSKLNWKDFVCGAIIFVPATLFITLSPIFKFDGILMEIVCIVYAIIISLMVGKSLANLIKNKNSLSLVIFIGSALFFISDFMLLLNIFANLGKICGILCLVTYYPAEILLAYSILHSAKQKEIQNLNENI